MKILYEFSKENYFSNLCGVCKEIEMNNKKENFFIIFCIMKELCKKYSFLFHLF